MRAKHYKEMAEYAEDAAYTDKPWELWECSNGVKWAALLSTPLWNEDWSYRRKSLSGKQISEGWIPWSGGENPVGDCRVSVIYRNGTISTRDIRAVELRWEHTGMCGDIFGYKILSDQYAKFKEALKDKSLIVRRQGVQIVDSHNFYGSCNFYSIYKIEPLGKENFYPGVFLRRKGVSRWLFVNDFHNSGVELLEPSCRYVVSFESLVKGYEIWNPDTKTWNPCYKEVKA